MEKKEKKGGEIAKKFFKKNLYYILLIVSLLAIGTIITLALVLNKDKPEPHVPVDNPEVKMLVPVESEYTIINDYVADKLFWFANIKTYKTHLAVDFGASEGTEVVATLDGTVEEVTNDILNGTTIVIKHSSALSTVYKSLVNPTVEVGDSVKRGDKIGEVSASMGIEKAIGPHLHFEVMVDGKPVDPNNYLTISSDK